MRSTRKSWQAKLDNGQEWKVGEGNKRYPGKMLIPTPRQVDGVVKEIPEGAVTSPKLIRQTLADRCGADTTCPLCVGIFLRICAEAAEEQRAEGHEVVSPYWRVVDERGRHFPKFPGGREGQDLLLAAEIEHCTT